MQSKRWTIKTADELEVKKLQNELGIKHRKVCEILVQRGIKTAEAARKFFNPMLEDLHDPFLMKSMDVAVDRIRAAIDQKEKILIYGDYDVDGTTSVALMYLFLRPLHDQLDYYIPDRYSEGYGVSMQGIDYASQNGYSLIIALDCGITANHQVAYAHELGIDFIICDHHLPNAELPNAVAILNPKRSDCQYPFKELSGCGVGFKLCQAMTQSYGLSDTMLMSLLDLVAVSIASDIVPIVEENRILAYYGLKKLNEDPNIGLKSLIEWAGLTEKEIQVSDVVFSLGPRINAPGRMAHAKASVEILISQELDLGRRMAAQLDQVNSDRRSTDEQMTLEAINNISKNLKISNQKSIVLTSPEWHKGVIGIVASRLVERYYRPTIIFSQNGDVLTGSARSIKGFSIYQGIKQCESLVSQFGGHDFAAGVSLPKENFQQFVDKFEQVASQMISEEMLIPEIEIDTEIEIEEITESFYNIIKRMSPFGPNNMAPVFKMTNLKDTGGTRVVGKNHIRFSLRNQNNNTLQGICFGLADYYDIKDIKRNSLDICFSLQENHYNGRVTIDYIIKDIAIND